MTKPMSRIPLGIIQSLTAPILLLQVLSLVSLVQSYRGDISHARLSSELPRGPVGLPTHFVLGEDESSPHAFSQRRRGGLGEGMLRLEGRAIAVTKEQCEAIGLEKCGNYCVSHCCNADTGMGCPANSECKLNGDVEFCCEKGHACDINDGIGCLDFGDTKCQNNAGHIIMDPTDGLQKACCYENFETCKKIGTNAYACVPPGAEIASPSTIKQTQTSSTHPSTAQNTGQVNTPTSTTGPTQAQATPGLEDGIVATPTKSSAQSTEPTCDLILCAGESPYPDTPKIGTIIGGVVGGIVGLLIVAIGVLCTGKYYQRKLMEEKESELGDSSDCGRRGRSPSGATSSGSIHWPGTWNASSRDSRILSNWSKSTLSETPEKGDIKAVEHVRGGSKMSSRVYGIDARLAEGISPLNMPQAKASKCLSDSHEVRGGTPFEWKTGKQYSRSNDSSRPSSPFDWKSCQPLEWVKPRRQPEKRPEPQLRWSKPWFSLHSTHIPTSSPIIGPWSSRPVSMLSEIHRLSRLIESSSKSPRVGPSNSDKRASDIPPLPAIPPIAYKNQHKPSRKIIPPLLPLQRPRRPSHAESHHVRHSSQVRQSYQSNHRESPHDHASHSHHDHSHHDHSNHGTHGHHGHHHHGHHSSHARAAKPSRMLLAPPL